MPIRGLSQLAFLVVVVLLVPLTLRQSREVEREDSKRDLTADLPKEIAALKRKKPDVVFVGNSMLFTRILRDEFESLSGLSNRFLTNPGSASACWYLFLKNILIPSEHRPEVVVIFFRDQVLTWPEFRTGSYFASYVDSLQSDDEPVMDRVLYDSQNSRGLPGKMARAVKSLYGIDNQPERYQDKFNDLALDLSSLGQGKGARREYMNDRFSLEHLRHDLPADDIADLTARGSGAVPQEFDSSPDASFLPHILDIADEHDLKLIFYRVKKRVDVDGARPPSPDLRPYLDDLKNYVESRGAAYVDETPDLIPVEWYADGDHIGREWRDEYTQMFWEKNRSLFPMKPE